MVTLFGRAFSGIFDFMELDFNFEKRFVRRIDQGLGKCSPSTADLPHLWKRRVEFMSASENSQSPDADDLALLKSLRCKLLVVVDKLSVNL